MCKAGTGPGLEGSWVSGKKLSRGQEMWHKGC